MSGMQSCVELQSFIYVDASWRIEGSDMTWQIFNIRVVAQAGHDNFVFVSHKLCFRVPDNPGSLSDRSCQKNRGSIYSSLLEAWLPCQKRNSNTACIFGTDVIQEDVRYVRG